MRAANSMLERGMALLSAFRPGDVELSLSELSRRTGIPKSTVHRLLGELAECGMVERSSSGIRLGLRLFELGAQVPQQRGIREAAAPILAGLFETTHETVHLAVLDGVEVVYVQKIDGRCGPAAPSRIGGRMPAYCTGVGKALLAFAPPGRVAAVLRGEMLRRTPRSIDNRGRLSRELALIAGRGIAEDHEESAVGVACVAAPVLGASGYAVAAVSITGWANRLNAIRLAPAVRTAALEIARSL